MEGDGFRRLLEFFPVVRPRDYHVDLDPSRQSSSRSTQNQILNWQDAGSEGDRKGMDIEGVDLQDEFWEKLKLVAARKVGTLEADRLCKAFQQIHKKLVYEELSLDAARRFLKR